MFRALILCLAFGLMSCASTGPFPNEGGDHQARYERALANDQHFLRMLHVVYFYLTYPFQGHGGEKD